MGIRVGFESIPNIESVGSLEQSTNLITNYFLTIDVKGRLVLAN